MRRLLYLILICLTLSCSESGERRMALQRAVSVMNSAPDSALHILDSLGKYESQFGRHFRMQCGLHRLNAFNKLDTLFRSTEEAQQYADYFDAHGTPNEQMLAHYLLGRAYYDMGESPMALECYQTAVSKADTTAKDCDYLQMSRVYGQMAELYYDKRVPQYCLNAVKEAESAAWKAKDTLNAIRFYAGRLFPYDLWNMSDSVLSICYKSRLLYGEYGYYEEKARILPVMIKCLIDKEYYSEAYKYFNEYEINSGLFHNGEIKDGLVYNYYLKGMCLYGLNKLDSAEIYFQKLSRHTEDIDMLEAAYRGLTYLYMKRNMQDSLLKYSRLFCDANDTASLRQSSLEILRTQALYDYTYYKDEAIIAKEESNKYHRTIIFICIIIVLLASVLVISFLRYRKKKRKMIKQQNERYEALYSELDKAREDYELLQSDADAYRIGQEEKIHRLCEAISMYHDTSSEMGNWTVDDFLIESPIVKQLQRKIHGNTKMTVSEQACLVNLVNKHNPDFISRLNILTDKERIVCILIRLDFSPSDIVILLDMTKQNVSNLRSSINQKLFKSKGTKGLDLCLKRL